MDLKQTIASLPDGLYWDRENKLKLLKNIRDELDKVIHLVESGKEENIHQAEAKVKDLKQNINHPEQILQKQSTHTSDPALLKELEKVVFGVALYYKFTNHGRTSSDKGSSGKLVGCDNTFIQKIFNEGLMGLCEKSNAMIELKKLGHKHSFKIIIKGVKWNNLYAFVLSYYFDYSEYSRSAYTSADYGGPVGTYMFIPQERINDLVPRIARNPQILIDLHDRLFGDCIFEGKKLEIANVPGAVDIQL